VTQQADRVAGKVYLVGAGPGDPRLITVRGAECLAAADVVFYDYLVNAALLEHAPARAERICLGHPHTGRRVTQCDILARIIAAAQAGKTVVRLKSGDPSLFGRGGEEICGLAAAGLYCEVVPGVTAAVAAASHAGIPLTHRDHASAVALVTGHQRADGAPADLDYDALARFPGTLVFYMGVASAQAWSQALLNRGKAPHTPVAIVRRATWPDQSTYRATLATVSELIQRQDVRPPAVIIVGDVAAGEACDG
jgi:uroporphyrinogen III methyltransferase/synthase